MTGERIYNEDGIAVAEVIGHDGDGLPVVEDLDQRDADHEHEYREARSERLARRQARGWATVPDDTDEIPF